MEFWATISHEIRTPLKCIVGVTSLLAQQQLPAQAQEYVQTADAAGKSLDHLLNDILDYSKLRADKLSVIVRPFNVCDSVEKTMRLMWASYRPSGKCYEAGGGLRQGNGTCSKPIRLFLKIKDSVPRGPLLGDEGRIRQCLVNYLANAFRCTDEGEVTVTVACSAVNDVSMITSATSRQVEDNVGHAQCGENRSRSLLCDFNPLHLPLVLKLRSFRKLWERRMERISTVVVPREPTRSFLEASEETARSYLDNMRHRVRLTITVEDTGIGMTPQQVSRLFRPFAQIHGVERRGAAGLGLMVSRYLSRAMGGGVCCRSTVGYGSTFEFHCLVGVPEETDANFARIYPAPGQQQVSDASSDSIDDNQVSYGEETVEISATHPMPVRASPSVLSPDGSGCQLESPKSLRELATLAAQQDTLIEAALDSSWDDDWDELWEGAQVLPGIPRRNRSPPATNSSCRKAAAETVDPVCSSAPSGGSSRRYHGLSRRRRSLSNTNSEGTPGLTTEPLCTKGPLRQILSQGAPHLLRPLKVLVVDDGRINRLILEQTLVSLGVEVTTAESGDEAIRVCHSELFSVILMDLYMPPGCTGPEATRTIRAGGGLSANAPVVCITATESGEETSACAAAGMDDIIVKPVQTHILINQLCRWASKREVCLMRDAWETHRKGQPNCPR